MRILLTGSSGFIGGHLIKLLHNTGYDILHADIKQHIDICDWEQVKYFEQVDVVIHLANLSYVPDSYQNPRDFYRVNFVGTLNMLELCRLNKAKFIYLSSYVYGIPQYQPIDEKHPVQAFNPYAESKVICEKLCEGYARDFGISVTIIRPFNVYGEGQNANFLIPTIIQQARNGFIRIKDDRPKRDYVHVNDVVRAIHLSIETEQQNNLEIYNIGSGKSYSVKEIVEIIIGFLDKKIDYQCTNEIRVNEVLDTIACIDKARSELHWEPTVSLKDGLKALTNL